MVIFARGLAYKTPVVETAENNYSISVPDNQKNVVVINGWISLVKMVLVTVPV